jgi:hypothetical protein
MDQKRNRNKTEMSTLWKYKNRCKRGVAMNIQKYLTIIPDLKYKEITNEIWNTILSEGLNIEKMAYDKNDWEYANLPISETDKNGLKKFNKEVVEEYNNFDIQLKEMYHMRYVDLIDYNKGIVRIVKVKGR